MKHIEITHGEDQLLVTCPFDSNFINQVKGIGGWWDSSERVWNVPKNREEELRIILLNVFGWSERGKNITVEYLASDFVDYYGQISIGKSLKAKRAFRDYYVTLYDTVIISGGFPASGGSRKFPQVKPKEGTILRSQINEHVYDNLPNVKKKKLKIITDKTSKNEKKEKLLKEKEQLLKKLNEIENELEKL